MKRSRFSEEQIIGILREQEAGSPTADVCRKHGVSSATFYTTLRRSADYHRRLAPTLQLRAAALPRWATNRPLQRSWHGRGVA